ncbi:MAG: hypothetical protein V2A61_05070, partial [Calditrichota bacterium]
TDIYSTVGRVRRTVLMIPLLAHHFPLHKRHDSFLVRNRILIPIRIQTYTNVASNVPFDAILPAVKRDV